MVRVTLGWVRAARNGADHKGTHHEESEYTGHRAHGRRGNDHGHGSGQRNRHSECGDAADAGAPPSENAKLNKVATPNLSWFNCYGGSKCANVEVPLDYDDPKGEATNVAVLRTPATGKRIGTLFVNPGGPGGSATEMAQFADEFLSPEVREKFDVVGVDPRGVGFSDNVECLSVEEQDDVLEPLSVGVPVGYQQEQRYINSSKKLSRACSKNKLATSMSTAEVARDMEMVRRGLGEGKLSYLGFSYGSQLGTTYANMFPSNFRSIAIDGTLSPTAWSGTDANENKPLESRLKSGKGAWKAMEKILDECGEVGEDRCMFAASGDPEEKFTEMADQLKKEPVTVEDPSTGETMEVTYGDFVGTLLGAMYESDAPVFVDSLLTEMEEMLEAEGAGVARAETAEGRAEQKRVYDALKSDQKAPQRGFEYDNSLDSFLSVTCTDSRETTKIADYPAFAKQSDETAPHFGRAWLWGSAGCAGDAFTGEDEDAWTGPYDRVTPKAVLVVGNEWDPTTNHEGAVEAHDTLGRSRLVSSDSWGHTAYGVSECATKKIDTYLISGAAPLRDATCPAEEEMFPSEEQEARQSVPQILAEKSMSPRTASTNGFPAPDVVR